MLRAGIVGLPNVGKSTLFNAVTRTRKAEAANYPFCTIDPNVGIVTVPDARLAVLQKIAKTGVVIPAAIEFVDIAGLVKGASQGEGLGNKFLTHIREVDAIVQVVRCFEDDDVHHVSGTVDPVRDIEVINTELMLADLESVRKRRERVAKDVKRGDKRGGRRRGAREDRGRARRRQAGAHGGADAGGEGDRAGVLPALRQADDLRVQRQGHRPGRRGQQPVRREGARVRQDAPGLRGGRDQRADRERPGRSRAGGSRGVPRGARRDGERHGRADPRHLPPARPATYFTAGEKEVRAWTIHAGDTAPKAAGVIHSDFERGFIKAETVAYDDLVACGSVAAAREKGLYRMEGKEYVVADGDVLLFKFNV